MIRPLTRLGDPIAQLIASAPLAYNLGALCVMAILATSAYAHEPERDRPPSATYVYPTPNGGAVILGPGGNNTQIYRNPDGYTARGPNGRITNYYRTPNGGWVIQKHD